MLEPTPYSSFSLKPIEKKSGLEAQGFLLTQSSFQEKNSQFSKDSNKVSDQVAIFRQAKQETQQIGNRIRLLSLEEEKVMKQISAARKKADAIIMQRERHAITSFERYKRKQDEMNELQIKQVKIKIYNEVQKEVLQITKEIQANRLNSEVKPIKELKELGKVEIQMNAKDILLKKQEVIKNVKEYEKLAEIKKEKYQEEKIQRAKLNYEYRLNLSISKKQNQQDIVEDLEKQEKIVLLSFEGTQMLKKQAMDEFKQILEQKRSPFESPLKLIKIDQVKPPSSQQNSPSRQPTSSSNKSQDVSFISPLETSPTWNNNITSLSQNKEISASKRTSKQLNPLSHFFVRSNILAPLQRYKQYQRKDYKQDFTLF